jgi:AcrR family transcriptional regulator
MTQLESESQQSTRTRLIEAAIHCFSEKGFDGTGIREIAQRAQANSALVQYHFGGKEGLYTAALGYIFECKAPVVAAPPESADAPGARAQAIQAMREMLHYMTSELVQCQTQDPLERLAMLMITREMLNPRAESIDIMVRHIRPYNDHLDRCLRVLRPDLDEDARYDMINSIYGPIFHLHSCLPLARGLRGDPAYPRDLDRLVDHFMNFSLRGLGLADSSPNQGV